MDRISNSSNSNKFISPNTISVHIYNDLNNITISQNTSLEVKIKITGAKIETQVEEFNELNYIIE